jgi:PhzF family phenazine biosynthesis protein
MAYAQFSVVDVFSCNPYRGNPLAIVNDLERNLTETQMRLIASQFNLSETTFFSRPSVGGADYALRSFLPNGREVFGIGHNILGVWWYLAHEGLLEFTPGKADHRKAQFGGYTFHQELGGLVSPVKILRESGPDKDSAKFSVSITQATPKFHRRHPQTDTLAKTIGLSPEDIGLTSIDKNSETKEGLTPRVLSTSTTHHLFVPIASVEALERASVQRDELVQQLLLAGEHVYGLYLFARDNSKEDGGNTYRARFFSPGMSNEDPATGSAAGPLSAFLHSEGHLQTDGGKASIEVWQGFQVGRECILRVDLTIDHEGQYTVDVVGDGVKVSEGKIILP